jgi:alpha-1,6-mannosyltransferase
VRTVWPAAALVAVGVLLEAVLLWRMLRPFSLVAQPGPQLAPEPIVEVLGVNHYDGRGLAAFLLTFTLLFVLYFGALILLRFVEQGALLRIAAGFGVIYALTLWPTIPLGSTDVYHYILDGRALLLYGGNPLSQPPAAFPQDPLTTILWYNRTNTGAYGPVFYALAAGAAWLGHSDLVWSTLAMKALSTVGLLACAPLLYALAERTRPGRGAAALVVFLWNPLILFEVGASGHNDSLVAVCGLLAFWLAATGRWWWAPLTLAVGMLIKPTTVLLLPPLLAWLWFQPNRPSLARLAGACGAALALIVVLYIPFWAGTDTFMDLRRLTHVRINSPGDTLAVLLMQSMAREQAVRTMKLITGGAFLIASGIVLLRTRGRRPDGLVWAAFWCMFAYMMLACWWFWPWYLVTLIALGAVLWPSRAGALAVVFSCSALLLYAGLGWRVLLFSYQNEFSQSAGLAVMGFLAPALVWVSGWWGPGEVTHDRNHLPPGGEPRGTGSAAGGAADERAARRSRNGAARRDAHRPAAREPG